MEQVIGTMQTPEGHLVIGLAWAIFIMILVVEFGWKSNG